MDNNQNGIVVMRCGPSRWKRLGDKLAALGIRYGHLQFSVAAMLDVFKYRDLRDAETYIGTVKEGEPRNDWP
jgi:hypothetical protein